ncbi:hypothetical protein BDP27DRAFT_1363111 [Rhodocollybia butyracea]|uniref:Uncharacterized protein n=1 Tax=Rhodocollybia butyracea TaxID=206335 RepID=A0A9P5U7C4_9AGAR|nr:hypothetical protein BDP27DRAFT_1363111 [Rhodocollybia butyracea]
MTPYHNRSRAHRLYPSGNAQDNLQGRNARNAAPGREPNLPVTARPQYQYPQTQGSQHPQNSGKENYHSGQQQAHVLQPQMSQNPVVSPLLQNPTFNNVPCPPHSVSQYPRFTVATKGGPSNSLPHDQRIAVYGTQAYTRPPSSRFHPPTHGDNGHERYGHVPVDQYRNFPEMPNLDPAHSFNFPYLISNANEALNALYANGEAASRTFFEDPRVVPPPPPQVSNLAYPIYTARPSPYSHHPGTISTGDVPAGYPIPSFETHPNGRIVVRPGGHNDAVPGTMGGSSTTVAHSAPNRPYRRFVFGDFASDGSITPTQSLIPAAASHRASGSHRNTALQNGIIASQNPSLPSNIPDLRFLDDDDFASRSAGLDVDTRSASRRRSTVSHAQPSTEHRSHSGSVYSRPRAQSLNEKAPAFVPQRKVPSVSPHSQDEVALLDVQTQLRTLGISHPHEILNLDNIRKNLFLLKPIVMEELPIENALGLLPLGKLPLLVSLDISRSVNGCVDWLKFQENTLDAIVYLCRYLVVAGVVFKHYTELPQKRRTPPYLKLISELDSALAHHPFFDQFRTQLAIESELALKEIFQLNLPPGSAAQRLLPRLFDIGQMQARILGILYKLDIMPFTKFLEILWFLLEGNPHLARLVIIQDMILNAGPKISYPSNNRSIGDFLTALSRRYVLPAPGGLFPDVFLACKEEKQDVFNHVRANLKYIQSLIYDWRQVARQK